jgi:hypothetical protein
MATLEEKIERLRVAREKVEAFIAGGGDIKSRESVPLGMELVLAANEVGIELGYNLLKPVKKPVDFIRPDPASQR